MSNQTHPCVFINQIITNKAIWAFILGYSVKRIMSSIISRPSVDNGSKECIHLGIELGGTTCKVGKAKVKYENGKIVQIKLISQSIIATTCPIETIEQIMRTQEMEEVEHIGIASFGPISLDPDRQFGSITSTPKVEWQNFPLLETIRSKCIKNSRLKSINIETDVNAAAKVEYMLGNHNVKTSLAYVTVGTGVGVGYVINQKTVHGLTHPEGGHIVVRQKEGDQFNGVCVFHQSQCLEGNVSNQAIAKRKGVTIEQLEHIDDSDQVWDTVAYYLAQLCLTILLQTSVEVIVLGGGVMNRKVLYSKTRSQFKQLLNNYVVHPKLKNLEQFITSPTFELSGLYGAFCLNQS